MSFTTRQSLQTNETRSKQAAWKTQTYKEYILTEYYQILTM